MPGTAKPTIDLALLPCGKAQTIRRHVASFTIRICCFCPVANGTERPPAIPADLCTAPEAFWAGLEEYACMYRVCVYWIAASDHWVAPITLHSRLSLLGTQFQDCQLKLNGAATGTLNSYVSILKCQKDTMIAALQARPPAPGGLKSPQSGPNLNSARCRLVCLRNSCR